MKGWSDVRLYPGPVGPAVFLLLLLRLGVGILLRVRQAAPVGEPGVPPRPPAAHLRLRRHHHPVCDPAGGGPFLAGVSSGHAGRHGAGICGGGGDGAAVQGPLLGLHQAALQPQRLYLPHQFSGLGFLLRFDGVCDPSPYRPAAPQAAGPAGEPAGGGHCRGVHRGYGEVHQGGHRPAGGPYQAHRGERGTAEAGPEGGGRPGPHRRRIAGLPGKDLAGQIPAPGLSG